MQTNEEETWPESVPTSCQRSEKRSHYLNIKEQGTFRTVSTSSVCLKQVLAKEFKKRETNTTNKENQHPKKTLELASQES